MKGATGVTLVSFETQHFKLISSKTSVNPM